MKKGATNNSVTMVQISQHAKKTSTKQFYVYNYGSIIKSVNIAQFLYIYDATSYCI